MFPKNCWYVAAMAREVEANAVLARTICNIPMAIFRAHDGSVGALIDRCPHRLYPLSAGVVQPDGLRCAYHGLTFSPKGRCTQIPSQAEIPANATVQSFPIQEAGGFIWVWPGDQAMAKTTPLPSFETGPGYLAGLDFSCLEPSERWGVAGPHVIHLNANYMLVIDNLLDLTHGAFVHAKTFDVEAVLDASRTVKPIGDRQMIDSYTYKNKVSRALRIGYKLDEAVPLYESFMDTYWQAPGVMLLVHGAMPVDGDREKDGAIILNANILTPATEGSCHYFWAQCVYRNRGDGQVRYMWDMMTKAAFAEDEEILATQQANLEKFGGKSLGDDVSLMLKADKAIVLARRIVARQIRDETQAPNSPQGAT